MKIVFTVSLCLLTSLFVYSQEFIPDSSFADSGSIYQIFPYTNYYIHFACGAIHGEQSDGKIIASQSTVTGNGVGYYSFFARYNTNGTLDSSFGINGEVLLDGVSASAIVRKAIVLKNNKILAVIDGSSYASYTQDPQSLDFICIRLNADGSFDKSFGNSGIVKTDIHFQNTDSYDIPGSLAADSTGRIIISGYSINRSCSNCETLAAVRYLENGHIDSSFAINGMFTQYISPGVLDASTYFTEIKPDGKIIMDIGSGTGVVQLNENGSIDSSFGLNGVIQGKIVGYSHEQFHDLRVFSDGSFYACSSLIIPPALFSNLDSFSLDIYKFKANGAIDSSFAGNGKLAVFNGSSSRLIDFHGLVVQNDSKMIIAIDSSKERNIDYLKRYNVNGTEDSTFGGIKGLLTYTSQQEKLFVLRIDINNFYANNLLMDTQHRLLFLGTSSNPIPTQTGGTVINRYMSNIILPVKIINLKIEQQKQNIILNWQTANEVNNNYFSIERSPDAKLFYPIGNKQALNNPNKASYFFIDNTPLNGMNYYRLKQVDNDGRFTYSNIVSVDFSSNAAMFAVYPNPTTNTLNITLPSINKTSDVLLYDATGKELIHEQLASNMTAKQIDISKLSEGIYNVVLIQYGKQQTIKVVKK